MKTVYLLHFLLFQMSKTNLKITRIVIFIRICRTVRISKHVLLKIFNFKKDGTNFVFIKYNCCQHYGIKNIYNRNCVIAYCSAI